MNVIYKTYKYRMYPNENQKILLEKHFGCVRFVYNHFLSKNIGDSKQKLFSYKRISNELTNLKKQNEYSWLYEVGAQSLQQSLKHLDAAFTSFFKNEKNIPTFKCKNNKQSFSVPQNIKVSNKKLFICKFTDGIKISYSRQITGKILYATINKTKTNKYFVCITCKTECVPCEKTNTTVGIDTGIKTFAMLSNGIKYEGVKSLHKNLKKVKYQHKKLSKKSAGSNNRKKQRLVLAKVYENISNTRKDFLHKTTTDIVKNHDIICVESLNLKNLYEKNNTSINRGLIDSSLGSFYEMLEYKALWNNKVLIKIDQYFPSSKMCFGCGNINQDLKLNDREWTCTLCKSEHDRDLNAAKNILHEGLKNCGYGIESQYKQKQGEASALAESMNLENNNKCC